MRGFRHVLPGAGAVHLLPLIFAALAACGDAGTPGTDSGATETVAPTFTNVWTQVLQPSCAFSSCHGSGTGGLDLPDQAGAYASLVSVASVGDPTATRVVPGDADGSYLVQKLEGSPGITGDPMPVGGALAPAELQLVRDWIDAGAQDD